MKDNFNFVKFKMASLLNREAIFITKEYSETSLKRG